MSTYVDGRGNAHDFWYYYRGKMYETSDEYDRAVKRRMPYRLFREQRMW